jgi:hypothetical protein
MTIEEMNHACSLFPDFFVDMQNHFKANEVYCKAFPVQLNQKVISRNMEYHLPGCDRNEDWQTIQRAL